ncbi:hypothetical protein ED312_00135 [Sinomicrobium pectinilyticum]|uniref:Uncharacterized protein n=1 Tax=Sinomicrobium pectinilyticum TaxID=1084421 RepID=A0A3N0F4J2_SINP1|nr:hypothetical protein ED312_00135 [Sinomicrobium pectinilyticum]
MHANLFFWISHKYKHIFASPRPETRRSPYPYFRVRLQAFGDGQKLKSHLNPLRAGKKVTGSSLNPHPGNICPVLPCKTSCIPPEINPLSIIFTVRNCLSFILWFFYASFSAIFQVFFDP